MNAATLKALKGSIAHWKRMRAKPKSTDERPVSDHCPLCKMFLDGIENRRCQGCPVMEKTGVPGCEHTPYNDAYDAFFLWEHDNKAAIATWRRLALLEIKFLQSLLPVKRKKS